jgi:hypothetical protein
MAELQIDGRCLLCGQAIKSGTKAVVMREATMTDVAYGEYWKKGTMKEGFLRPLFKSGPILAPFGLICLDCWEDLIQWALAEKTIYPKKGK